MRFIVSLILSLTVLYSNLLSFSAETDLKKVQAGQVAVDTGRWQEVYRKKDVKQYETVLYVDNTTIQKNILSHSWQPGSPAPVLYSFWLKMRLLHQGDYVSSPIQASVNCWDGTMNEKIPAPESADETIFRYFCFGVDAQQVLQTAQAQFNLKQAQEAQTAYQAKMQSQAYQQQHQGQQTQYLNQGAGLLRQLLPALGW